MPRPGARAQLAHRVRTCSRSSSSIYRVTTQTEFKETLNQFYGAEVADTGDIGDLLAGLDEDEDEARRRRRRDDVSAAADNELVKLVNKIIIDAYNQGASDIHIEPYPGKGKTEIRFRKDGSLCSPTSRCRPATATPSSRA